MSDLRLVSVVVPVYNNAGSLEETCKRVLGLFDRLQLQVELIFVNDGSSDDSMQELLRIHGGNGRVKVLDFSRNFGQIPAIAAGVRHSKGDVVISVSADLQDPIDLMENMIQHHRDGKDIVIAYREARQEGFIKKLTSRIYFSMVRYHVKKDIPTGGFDYFLLSRSAADALNLINDRIRGLHFDILSLGFEVTYVPYERQKREHGKSQYSFFKRLNDFINAFISISYLPIRMIMWVGFSFALIGFLYAISITYAWLKGYVPFEGWAPIMVLILITGGLTMMMLGIIGEYIWRIYEETKERPRYIIKKIYD